MIGAKGGIRDVEVLVIYGRARAAQKERVTEKALELAGDTDRENPPAVGRIMDDAIPREPTEAESTAAWLALYAEQSAPGAR